MATGKYTRTPAHIEHLKRAAFIRNGSMTPEQRFWSKIQKSDGCWEWQGQRNHKGYGEVSVRSKWVKAHRFAWASVHGPIPPGMQVCHHCDNRACVRPAHLFVGTNSDNQRDAVKKGRGPGAKLSPQDVRAIRGLLDQVSVSKIAAQFGTSETAIYRIKLGQAYSYVE